MTEKIIKEITNSFLNYLHLYSWLNIKIHKQITSRSFEFKSVENFWNLILAEELRPGDIIKIKEGFVTDWIPRIPGGIWNDPTKRFSCNSDISLLEALKIGSEYSSSGIYNNDQSSLGIVRLPFGNNTKNFAVLSITSYDCWAIDLGIPIVVSKEVYYQFIKNRVNNKSVEADIEATLEFGELPLLNKDLIKSFGSDCSPEFIEQYNSPLNIPRIYLRLSSPLSAKFRTHNSHPNGTIWCLNKHSQSHQAIHHVQEGRVEIIECPYNEFIAYDTAHIDVSNQELFGYYIDAFKEGHAIPKEILPTKRTELPSKKVTVLTEFDGQRRYFDNSIPISEEPWKNEMDKEKIRTILKLLDKENNGT